MRIYRNWVGGEWRACLSGRLMDDRNPADRRDLLGRFQRSQANDISAAVCAAKNALPGWKTNPAPKRAEILFKSARILEEKKERLAHLMTREMGKTLKETRADVQETIDTAYYYAGEGRRLFGQTTPSELKDKLCFTLRRPVGVCGLITPWNFPLAIPSWKIYPALICGNTVVLKPAEDTPLMSLLLAEILSEAGLPGGVLNVVTGTGEEAGRALVEQPDISLISFTGSSSVGAQIASSCGSSLKRCSLEMGGKNALIVLEDADMKLAVEAALWGSFATSGQRCTATSRILVSKKIHDKFLDSFIDKAKRLIVGRGDEPASNMGPLINAKQLRSVDNRVKHARRQGARLVLGGSVDAEGDKRFGHFYKPTVFTHVSPGMKIAREEVFGPVAAFIKVRDYEEAIRISNDSAYGLSSAVFTRDIKRAMKSLADLETGITYINSSTVGAEAHLPFGGVKNTGNGHREAGVMALDIFSEWKTVYIDHSGHLQKAQMD